MPSRPAAITRALFLSFSLCLALPASAQPGPEPASVPARVTAVVGGLNHPWAMAFLPEGGVLITERPGNLRLLRIPGGLSKPLAGVPKVAAQGQGGLLDVALSPDFAQDRYVYLSYAEADGSKSGTAVGRGKLSADGSALEDFRVLFRQQPKLSSGLHYGSRLVFDGKGYLYISLGENNQRPTAQDLDKLQGKVVRLKADGSVPTDNPFVGQAGARPEIWSYGHRNPQGMALNPWSGQLWENEHGPRGGDEINLVQRGKNYGWPLATHGINYSGQPIPEAKAAELPGMEPPLYWWPKSPAISGMAFYNADRFPAWRNSVFIGALANQNLIRLTLDGDRVVAQEWLLTDRKQRIRDVRQGPDGYVYVLTDASPGELLRLAPAEQGE
ncbi:PQQ-dependent sugar dehydrogenase [Achromobacter sp. ACM03]|uniref:PQQ-dependent sugar dehydrogenase n=1 Tax=Achromobacter aegrifaciens TaxID=1287736 RepID=A0AAD2IZY7_ACHAE|nr:MULTISPECIES: PQQ-dependent sugar dehydrogenase [Achromobacter]MBD9429090.1 PQQ-dependent sugar dehydrogenase [Achromobacter sp. ACM03]MBD9473782.1 PQQ-dependent sugar dehydrogenase [Achromobacter sp. ACM01]MDR7945559.1 PQQ-dependent sugar dehydrogenase [Achromobacter aegrifaciens]CAB3843226.1 Aldose sugar dehydrogenase YliI [Achromobacter aegrifaciens]CUJ11963.1 Soluble aldose sugar dehydrogenase yliI precursor [Achromobacter aegrifaciens]